MIGIGRLVHEHTPDWEQLTYDVLFGQVWQDARLSKRDRSLATVAMLMALRADGALEGHMVRALKHGVTRDELRALVTHSAFYGGWPCAEHAIRIMDRVLQEYEDDGEPCGKICCVR